MIVCTTVCKEMEVESVETYEARTLPPPTDWCYFPSEDRAQGASMAPRRRVCRAVANARLISRLMSPREEKDVPLLPVRIFSTNRGHSVFSKNDQQLLGEKKVARGIKG